MQAKKRNTPYGFATRAIHHGYNPQDYHGALNPPIFMSSTFGFKDSGHGTELFSGDAEGYFYHRAGNPTVSVLENRLAELEGAEAGIATSSGMGAITAAFWTLLNSGDEIIADKTLYGCTFSVLQHHIGRFGVKTTFIDMSNPDELARAISGNTRIVYCETPANPNMRLVDIAAIAEICKQYDASFIVDNTYCTPYLQRPIELGADIVVHSATKYLGGHGDLLAGAVIANREMIDQIRSVGLTEMNGAIISSLDAFLIMRGLKTLQLRMDRHSQTALKLAKLLQDHPAVDIVYYPGLVSSPFHQLASRQMSQYGGMIALELKGGIEAGRNFMDALQLVTSAVSLGDAETLVQHPASMTHAKYEPEEREKHGFTDGLIRISVGLEDYDDLATDMSDALSSLKQG